MSLRYAWEQWSTKSEYQTVTSEVTVVTAWTFYYADKITGTDGASAKFQLEADRYNPISGDPILDTISAGTIPGGSYFTDGTRGLSSTMYYVSEDTYFYREGSSKCVFSGPVTKMRKQAYTVKGDTLLATVTFATKTYPDNGAYESYWYVYRGSDNIDPVSLTYPAELKAGEVFTISLTPRANTYGGTITYTWEESKNGGPWTQVWSSTGISIQEVLTKDVKTFQVRVRASDNMGFTSADYVTGSTVNVKNSPVYAGVANVVRNPESNVGIGGISRAAVPNFSINGIIRS